jgi:hypothetical protein
VDRHHFDTNSPSFYFNANPDPTPLHSDGNLQPLVFRLSFETWNVYPDSRSGSATLQALFQSAEHIYEKREGSVSEPMLDPDPSKLDPDPYFSLTFQHLLCF